MELTKASYGKRDNQDNQVRSPMSRVSPVRPLEPDLASQNMTRQNMSNMSTKCDKMIQNDTKCPKSEVSKDSSECSENPLADTILVSHLSSTVVCLTECNLRLVDIKLPE